MGSIVTSFPNSHALEEVAVGCYIGNRQQAIGNRQQAIGNRYCCYRLLGNRQQSLIHAMHSLCRWIVSVHGWYPTGQPSCH